MISDSLRETLLRFAEGELSVRTLEEWLVPSAPALISDPSSDDSEVVACLELGLVEYGEGSRTLHALRDLVGAEVAKHPMVWVNYAIPVRIVATSNSSTSAEPSMTRLSEINFSEQAA